MAKLPQGLSHKRQKACWRKTNSKRQQVVPVINGPQDLKINGLSLSRFSHKKPELTEWNRAKLKRRRARPCTSWLHGTHKTRAEWVTPQGERRGTLRLKNMLGLKIAGLDGGPIKICAPCPGVWICIRAWPCHQAPALDQSKTTELRLPISETAANPVNYTAVNRSREARRLRPVTQAFKQINVRAAHTPPHAHTRKCMHTYTSSLVAKSQKEMKTILKDMILCLCFFGMATKLASCVIIY